MEHLNNIPTALLLFLTVIDEHYYVGCIAGSAALKHKMHELGSNMCGNKVPKGFLRACMWMKRNDIDVYVPKYNVGEGYDTIPCPEQIMNRAKENYGIDVVLLSNWGAPYMGVHNGVNSGIDSVITFGVLVGVNREMVQLITVNANPPNERGKGWHDTIVDHFDISVTKVAVYLSDLCTNKCKSFCSEMTEENIERGCFEYEVHPCLTFEHHMKRIMKYVRRGFQLEKLFFDELCSKEYQNYILTSLKHLFAPQLMKGMVGNSRKTIDEAVMTRILSMLGVNNGMKYKLYVLDVIYSNARDIINQFGRQRGRGRYVSIGTIDGEHRFLRQQLAQKVLSRWIRSKLQSRTKLKSH